MAKVGRGLNRESRESGEWKGEGRAVAVGSGSGQERRRSEVREF